MLAALYDIHGNELALDAVLADAAAHGATSFLLGGDYALFGARPAEVVERLRSLDAVWIRGNGERWTAHPGEAPDGVQDAIALCRELLGEATVEELGALPEATVIDGTRFVHGSPVSDVRSFFPEPLEDEGELLDGVAESRLVFGHTHLQFERQAAGVLLVNPGSVGMPCDGDRRAAYALLGERIELRRVDYDWQAAADATRERLGEVGETPARRIEQARFDV